MKLTLICDESSTNCRYMVLGALVLPSHNHVLLLDDLAQWKLSRGLSPQVELKWTKCSEKYLAHYKSLVDWLFGHLRAEHLAFRAHVVDTGKTAYRQYGDGDLEKSFYKVYYHLLYQAVRRAAIDEEGSRVVVLLDDKTNRYPFRLPVVKKTLNAALERDLGAAKVIANIEPRRSGGQEGEPLIQVVDVLIGAIAYVRNGSHILPHASRSKVALMRHVETSANTNLSYDTRPQSPFNIWTFDVEKSMSAKSRRRMATKEGEAGG
ncbi:MAG: DUF3800 domain-containing protein [Calditrichaeota bacterium]|nr:DUF3800 domain-containing protein [Calditrichota bacterium]